MDLAHNDAVQKLGLKRRQDFEGTENSYSDDNRRHFKRPSWAQLPIRASPIVPQDHLWQNQASRYQQPLTPVDSSDDEAHGQAHNVWSYRRLSASAQRKAQYQPQFPTVGVDNIVDEMDIGVSHTPALTKSSTTPQRRVKHLATPAFSLADRMPTPITTVFNLSENPSNTRTRQANTHTMLSPVMAEEPFMPSPFELNSMFVDSDMETTIRMERASSGFGALSVACKGDDVMEDAALIENEIRPTDTKNGRNARNAKLHMGFRADCEKCQQRVPGHYSHIIWS